MILLNNCSLSSILIALIAPITSPINNPKIVPPKAKVNVEPIPLKNNGLYTSKICFAATKTSYK